jgi:hypothetical protein
MMSDIYRNHSSQTSHGEKKISANVPSVPIVKLFVIAGELVVHKGWER